MKIQYHPKDAALIHAFLEKWTVNNMFLPLLFLDECEPLYFDCDAAELSNCFMELEKKGFSQSVKEIFQGSHFYRSDTGKCPRCWRFRPEIHWNNEHMPEKEATLCDRCFCATKKPVEEQ